ncbi:hypothetical protein OMAG_000307 [Candidatus Omnitrophus magneticus]|uniref:Fimbrial assembly family protein n=1 Tax=Candidatus Omnitrophus magneticus TaxID=1609969 RepID=A0A0F0CRD4_9BACT|nr:hypothetical protein OMAG_000307 [Candidatus Omnitrophus magneticus]
MIELNLLPESMRKKKNEGKEPPRFLLPIIFLAAIFILIISCMLLFVMFFKIAQFNDVKKVWDKNIDNRKMVDFLNSRLKQLEGQIELAKKISKSDFKWAKVLNSLNAAVVDNMWFSAFEIVSEKGNSKKSDSKKKQALKNKDMVVLYGYAVNGQDTATGVVAKFIDSLKKEKFLADYFEAITLQGVNKQMINTEEAMSFKIICRLRPN